VSFSVTILAPISAQVRVSGVTILLAIPHASVLPLSTNVGVTRSLPAESRPAETSILHLAVGGMVSLTVIVDEQVALLPLRSVTVRTVVFGPARFEQLQALLLSVIEAIPQVSKLPLSTWAGVIEAVPDAFRFSVTFRQTAVGARLSLVMITSSWESGQTLFETVQRKVFCPTVKPATPELGEDGMVITPVPEISVQVPEPVVGVFPANAPAAVQTAWSGPALAVVGFSLNVTFMSSNEGAHGAFEIVQRSS
jgi:hypothetical protein